MVILCIFAALAMGMTVACFAVLEKATIRHHDNQELWRTFGKCR